MSTLFKTVATKRGNTTNLKSHLKHNHPIQLFNLGTTTAAGAGEGSSRQLSVTDDKYKRDSAKWRTLTDSVTVRLCLPFPCVSTPVYGPSCFLSLVHSSPSVFDLLLT